VVKDKEVEDCASAKATLIGDVEAAVDAEITRIASETRSETGGLRDRDSRDADQNREEV
jgi:hypothetical protein